MKKVLLAFLLLGIVSVLSGCAVIDFLDGKNFEPRDDIPQQQYNGGGNSGGHAHH